MGLLDMRRRNIAYLGWGIGMIGQLLLPLGFKFFAFIIPVFLLCFSLRLKDDNFNIWLFICLLFPFVFIPSTFFTFDASKPLDGEQVLSGTYALAGIATTVFFVGLPTYLFASVGYATALGHVDSAAKNLIRGIIITGSLSVCLYIFTILDMDPTGGMIEWVADLYLTLIMSALVAPQTGYGLIQTGINGVNGVLSFVGDIINQVTDPTGQTGMDIPIPQIPDLPPLPRFSEENHGDGDGGGNILEDIIPRFDSGAARAEMTSRDYHMTIYAIHDCLPIIISHLCLITAIFFSKEKWENRIIHQISLFFREKPHRERAYHPGVDLWLWIYVTIIIGCAFFIFLTYPQSLGQDPQRDWRYGGFFGLYLIMILVTATAISLFPKHLYYKESNIANTVKGTVTGLILLILLTRLFFTHQTMSAYSYSAIQNDLIFVAETFIFVAPAESLFFFVLCPGLVAGQLFLYNERKRKTHFEASQHEKIIIIDANIDTYTKMMEIAKNRKDKKLYELLQATIDYLHKKKRREQAKEPLIIRRWKSLIGRENTLILFIIFGVALPAFAFATVHWPMIHMSTGLDYLSFWLCGLGIIYFFAALFFILIHYKFGYQASIQSHAIYNTFTILLIILAMGV